MPKVSDNFGPIYSRITLDGSGNGTTSFQAVGSAVRVSNIFFKVETSTAQAVCTIYKGSVSEGAIIFNSNSGSTGGNAKGNVDLFDGETLYVRWTGGDAGAIATATFTGQRIPFQDMRPTLLTFDDEIAAGDGSLVYPALKSPNFVTGVSGWQITRAGDAEFNDVDVRGSLEVNGSGNSQIRVYNSGSGPVITFRPADLAGLASSAIGEGLLWALSSQPSGVNSSFLYAEWDCPEWAFGSGAPNLNSPAIVMQTANWGGTTNPSCKITTTFGLSTKFDFDVTIDGNVTINGNFGQPNVLLALGQTLTTGVVTTLTPTVAIYDAYSMWDSVNTITLPQDGVYDLGINAIYASQNPAAGQRQARIDINGANHTFWTQSAVNLNSTGICVHGVTRILGNQGDQITFAGFQSSGGNLAIQGNSRVWVELIKGTAT